jgi:hypothetical protein
LVHGGVVGHDLSIVKASLLDSPTGRAFLLAIFHGLVKEFGGKNSETSLLVRIIFTLTVGFSKVGVGFRLRCSSSVLGLYGLAHRGGSQIRGIGLPGVAEYWFALRC